MNVSVLEYGSLGEKRFYYQKRKKCAEKKDPDCEKYGAIVQEPSTTTASEGPAGSRRSD